MIGGAMVSILAAITLTQPTISAVSPDRSVNIIGFYCLEKDCDGPPRAIGDSLVFDQAAMPAVFAGVPRFDSDWSIWLNCEVRRERLTACRLDNASDQRTHGSAYALELAPRLPLLNVDSKAPRALVQISHERSYCRSWDCVMEPPAPTSPTPQ